MRKKEVPGYTVQGYFCEFVCLRRKGVLETLFKGTFVSLFISVFITNNGEGEWYKVVRAEAWGWYGT